MPRDFEQPPPAKQASISPPSQSPLQGSSLTLLPVTRDTRLTEGRYGESDHVQAVCLERDETTFLRPVVSESVLLDVIEVRVRIFEVTWAGPLVGSMYVCICRLLP